MIITIFARAERTGNWPEAVELVIIVLLPKSDGGFRPIGLIPWLPRIWMRARRDVATSWERQHDRPFIYAGPAKGADVAAWKQAARAEHAVKSNLVYGIVLLDLVKAFERIRHAYLLQAAIKHDYPLWLLRLSLATYRLFRAIRIGNAYSQVVRATRGITAGSGFATTEMRLAVLTPLDDAHRAHPTVVPTAFVDDIACELAATATLLLTHLVGFVLMVCNALEEAGNEISRKKSICSASCARVGKDLQKALNKFEIKFQPRVKSLGTGLAAGTARNVSVLKKRLCDFRARLSRFAMLSRARVDTAKLLRTGGIQAMVYGEGVSGVSDSMLYSQRTSAAKASAPPSGSCGQDLDLALMIADASASGRADPAFDAHKLPIATWALAI